MHGRALAVALVAIACVVVSMGAPSACTARNLVMAWGLNKDGELGNGTTQNSAMPVEVSGLAGVAATAAGGHHALALLADGTLVAWGENAQGQLGDGGTTDSSSPVPVRGLSEVAMIAAGYSHSLALLSNGTVMAWGNNNSGQLGDGTTESSAIPVLVHGLGDVKAIAAGGSFSLALLADGRVVAWGEDFYGQLGAGSRRDSTVPVAVSGLASATAISAGFRHALALLADGTVMAWGNNRDGQLGDGSETERDEPVRVSHLGGVSAVSAGSSQSLAVVNGAVVAWGNNERGQLGIGNDTGPELCGSPPVFACSKTPVSVRGLAGVASVSAGGHNLALLRSGAIMAWGPNNDGQLGEGSVIGPELCGPMASPCSTIPVLSHTPGVAVGLSAGREFSLSLGPPPQEALPQIGRCVRVASGGAYGGASPRCVALSSTHNGHFEWLSGPGLENKFKDALNEPKLETVGRNHLDCSLALLEGEYTGPKTALLTHMNLMGCHSSSPSASCQSRLEKEGTIESFAPLEAELGFIQGGERPRVGWSIKPKPPETSLASFECGTGASTTLMSLKGSVIGRATPIDNMTSVFELRYTQSGGRQTPESFEGGVREVLTLASTPLIGATISEQAALGSKGARTGEEALEIKAKA